MNYELAYKLVLQLMDNELLVVQWLRIKVDSLVEQRVAMMVVELYGWMVEMINESMVESMVEMMKADQLLLLMICRE
jgi:hypothetical protein